MKNRLPEFRSEKEEAKFWDTHDSTDFQLELKKDRLTTFVLRPNPPGAMKYCLGCGYCLEGLLEERCPECGRSFDSNDPKTTGDNPHAHRRLQPGIRFLQCSLFGACLMLWQVVGPTGGLPFFSLGFLIETLTLIASLAALTAVRYRRSLYIWLAILISGLPVVGLVWAFVYFMSTGLNYMPFL